MTARLAALWPRTIAMQMVWVTLAAAVLINVLGQISETFISEPIERRLAFGLSDDAPDVVAELVRASVSVEQQQAVLAAATGAGLTVATVAEADMTGGGTDRRWVALLDGETNVVIGARSDLHVFDSLGAVNYTIVGVAVFASLTMSYACLAIVVPLSRFGRVARAFGQSPDGDTLLPETGTREISDVARALNDMRERIRGLIDARTRMLRAISHDLRTPLTRFRLRIERLPANDATPAILRDLDHIDRMIDDTLGYLRDGGTTGAKVFADLPSLVQTVCADFADLGHDVIYEGPQRLRVACYPAPLARALGNLVENGVKFGQTVAVRVRTADDRAVQIDVSDDGPGIPAEKRSHVTEPFFRGDESRRNAVGFGLGLAIVQEIVSNHGGRLALLANQPNGLIARITLDLPSSPAGHPGRPSAGRPEAPA
ncbi:ATP-binding protein [Marinivivus vitaminiproducens]|uniref:ATP-binding protein n=1 Tax=Marinivivus vitaminiproducens TaxID=3035935 RepID=UPI00279F820A|nr:ATP-binding protein [Geminicoccaceae bacterium SCSIO 64248]